MPLPFCSFSTVNCPLPLLYFGLGSLLAGQSPNEATLTFVDREDANQIEIKLNVSNFGASEDTTTVSGTMEVRVNLSAATATTDEFTILSAEARGSDLELAARSGLFARYDLTGEDLALTITTPDPPGVVDPATGEFDAAQYEVTTTGGSIRGTADSLLTEPQDVDFDLSSDPFSGSAEGTGTITVTPGHLEGRRLYFDLHVRLPVEFSDIIPVPDSPLPLDAEFSLVGNLEATGETFLEFPDYSQWAQASRLGAESQNALDLNPSVPNFFYYALGFERPTAPANLFQFSAGRATLKIGEEIALDDLEIQWSDDLATWERVPQSEMIAGSSLLAFGDPLAPPPAIDLADSNKKYLRLARPKP